MFENQRIVIWGAGREGQAVQKYLKNAHVSATVAEGPEIDLTNVDVIFKSPGISLYNPCIQKAISCGIEVLSSTNLFLKHLPKSVKTIAITGTKGKSTTSSLLAHILRCKGFDVAFGGNIGVPLIELPNRAYNFLVAELSSYQCADLAFPFDISVVLNLYPEHIDWHGSHDQYYTDKLNLLQIRQPTQQAIINADNPELVSRTRHLADLVYFNNPDGIHVENGMIKDGTKDIFPINAITNLKGMHNLENICAVLTVLKALKIDLDGVERDIITFQPLPHRLQQIGCVHGVTFVDDSISTTPQTAVAALKAFDTAKHIYLLVGGYDRQQDYTPLLDYVAENASKITFLTLPVTGNRIFEVAKARHLTCLKTAGISEAVQIAKSMAKAGEVVLLSPAAPSYHAYKNFEARGDDFAQNVNC